MNTFVSAIVMIFIIWFVSYLVYLKYWRIIKNQFHAEFRYFQVWEKEWVKQGHAGKWVLIKGLNSYGFCKDFYDLQMLAEQKMIQKPFIVYQIKKWRLGRPMGRIFTGTGCKWYHNRHYWH